MLKDFTVANLLDLNETIAAELFEGKTYPWEVLPEISDFIMKLGPTLNPSEYECKDGNVWIAKSAKIAPTAYINGPAIIGKDVEVRHCAFIRGHFGHFRWSFPQAIRLPGTSCQLGTKLNLT